MAKDPTQIVSTGPEAHLYLGDVGATEPATWDVALDGGSWDDLGFLKDPPDIGRDITSSDIEMWNALEPVRTIFTSDVNTVGLTMGQTNRLVFELYFGALTYTTEGSGVRIDPDAAGASIEKALCIELVDGTKVLRIFWRRCAVSDVGSVGMDKGDAVTWAATLKRLVPESGTPWSIQTNLAGLVSA